MPDNQEQQYQDELNQARAGDNEPPEDNVMQTDFPGSSAHFYFPWGMFFVAAFFDLIGIIPILNVFTEVLATMIFCFWHWQYAPKADYLANLIITKCCDFASLGLFPSNIAIVIIAYMKKRASAQAPAGESATGEPEPSAA